jgi:hypothetical protein
MSKIPLNKMKAPGEYRPGIWRGRVLQIKVTNACDLDCKNCSVGVGLARKLKRVFFMSPDQFRAACRSLKGFPGVIGMFGGNPCLHPKFEQLCEIFREEVPDRAQRGLWSNRLFGKGAICRETFGPHSNLNVHESQEAWDEIRRDWPEANPIQMGLTTPSHHGPLFGSLLDLGYSEEEMWDLVGSCFVNQTWSAAITLVDGQLRAYFCEIAATMAELTGDASHGTDVVGGWWSKPMSHFEGQVRQYCTRCLVAMNPRKIASAGEEPEEYTEAWKPLMVTIKGRPLKQVTSRQQIEGGGPATKYLPKGVMPAGHKE